MHVVKKLALAVSFAALPALALAAGGHDGVGCVGCHAIHTAKGEIIFSVSANKQSVNPKTKQPYSGTTALCLGCHEDSAKGGQGIIPVSGHISHPYGLASVDARIAKVPGELLRDGGRFECLGCHDPHPSNPYYKYLRVDTGTKGSKMDGFCAVCHPIKADPSAVQPLALFTSMDETGNRTLAPAKAGAAEKAPAAAPGAPAKKK